MKNLENEDTSLFEELYIGLNQAIDFARETGKAKVTLYENNSRLETVYDEMYALRA